MSSSENELIERLHAVAQGFEMPPAPPADDVWRGRRRVRRNRGLVAGAAAAAVALVLGVTTAVGGQDRAKSDSLEPVERPGVVVGAGNQPEVGIDNESGLPISIVLPEDADWFGGGTGVISEKQDTIHAGLAVFQARTLAGGSSACFDKNWHARSRKPADTAQALGRQLERLPRSKVTQPSEPTAAFGYDAIHVRLQVNNGCPSGQAYLVAEAESDFGVAYSDIPKEVVIDFLVVDVDGTPIVVALWNEADASSELVDRVTRVRDSISFVTGE